MLTTCALPCRWPANALVVLCTIANSALFSVKRLPSNNFDARQNSFIHPTYTELHLNEKPFF
ncbi:MAG: hypothetical protein K0S28_210 [Paucimonas sp.]|nr:hypothetical protein [Paucimonas sp.]